VKPSAAATPKLIGYAALAAIGLLAALVLGRPELAVLATPLALVGGLGLAFARRPTVELEAEVARERAVQGETIDLVLRIESDVPLEALELLVDLPAGLEVKERAVALRVQAQTPLERRMAVRCERWGGFRPGLVLARVRDPLGLFTYELDAAPAGLLRVYPLEESLRALVRPGKTQTFSGNEVARLKGDGIEFADVRPFVPGDRVRRINWRASARRGDLWVNEAHPERNTDVVVFLDAFAEARDEAAGTLDLAVRAASSLASRYLARRDRVGLVSFGGILRWLVPSMGRTQVYRIVDALLDTEIAFSYAWKGVDVIPPRTLPPQALVVALTPLLDERTAAALLDLRARGFDLAIVEVSPLPFVGSGSTEAERLARRLWALQRDVLRHRYRELGVAVAEWREDGSLQGAVEEVTAFRRAARTVHA
jgi:uncharacterized protein (DUF58 family)